MINRYFPETVVDGCSIIALVAIMGAKRGTGWRFSQYLASKKFKSGYKFIRFVDLSRYCRNKTSYGGHWESPLTEYEMCSITKKECAAKVCKVWRKLKRADTKEQNSIDDLKKYCEKKKGGDKKMKTILFTIFKKRMLELKILKQAFPQDEKYISFYVKGFRRLYHGENFNSEYHTKNLLCPGYRDGMKNKPIIVDYIDNKYVIRKE